ncbi:MAG: alpha/beta hydrolase [Pseudomonadota bacterium]
MKYLAATLLIAAALIAPTAQPAPVKATVVLVHGAFADGASWNGVAKILKKDGYGAIAVAVPLRGVRSDAQYVSDLLASLPAPIVLVGHSYGGMVISAAGNGNDKVKALVYVGAFAPEAGDTALSLSGKFPGSTLGPTLGAPVKLADGNKDLYIQQDKFHAQFAADVPLDEAVAMAVSQRPVAEAALGEAAGEPAWKTIPSWFVYGEKDLNIPAQALGFMAERAKSKETVVVKGASHVVMVTNPKTVAAIIERAAAAK